MLLAVTELVIARRATPDAAILMAERLLLRYAPRSDIFKHLFNIDEGLQGKGKFFSS